MKERLLHHIWDQQHLLPDLQTISGKRLKIIYTGQYNTSRGADFQHAILQINDEIFHGNIEIHQNTVDWVAHQHHEDPIYNSVILHVVYEHKTNLPYTIKEDGSFCEILELKSQTDNEITKLFAELHNADFKSHISICDLFALTNKEELIQIICKNGDERFFRKKSRFNAELLFHDFQDLLYMGIMEALGYEKNRCCTLALANHLCWDKLKIWKKEGLDELTLSAILLYVGNLFPLSEKMLPSELYIKLSNRIEYQTFTNDKLNLTWQLFRIRPVNHPVKRMIQAAIYLNKALTKNTLIELSEIIKTTSNKKALTKMIQYFSELFSSNEPMLENFPTVGKGFLMTILGNVVLPLLSLFGEKISDEYLMIKIEELYHIFPAQADNYITRFMEGYIPDAKKKLFSSNFRLQQGLHNLYYKHCRYQLCHLCLKEKKKILEQL